MSKFFIPPECIKGKIAVAAGAEAHHILDVMRLKKGDKITAFDGSGRLYQGTITDTLHKRVKLQLKPLRQNMQLSNIIEVALVQALPKANKMDYIIEKCTELGIDSIIPTVTKRTIVRLDREKQASRIIRWQKIAREAAKQCGRTKIPRIEHILPWPDVLASLKDFNLKLIACLSPNVRSVKETLQSKNRPEKVAYFIGPEGDFTPEEITQAQAVGCIAVTLGVNVFRCDTAASSALAMINYELRQ